MDYRSSDDLVDLALVMDVVRRYGGPGLQVSLGLPYIPYARQDPVEAYRTYYLTHKRDIAKWEKGVPAPEWWR